VRLVQEDLVPREATGAWSGAEELAAAAGCPRAFVDELWRAGLLAGVEGRYTPGDLLVVRACRDACVERDLDPADLTPLADLIREVGNYSDTLVDVHTVRAGERDAAPDLRRDVAGLCEALLWRSFETTEPPPAP
jgi:hypothetical protein